MPLRAVEVSLILRLDTIRQSFNLVWPLGGLSEDLVCLLWLASVRHVRWHLTLKVLMKSWMLLEQLDGLILGGLLYLIVGD